MFLFLPLLTALFAICNLDGDGGRLLLTITFVYKFSRVYTDGILTPIEWHFSTFLLVGGVHP